MTWIWQYTATAYNAVNLLPSTGSWATYYIKEALKQAGWVVKSSSDGTTYNASADQITTGNSGANGMANASAWFRIQSPAGAGGREFTFQRSTNLNWRVKFSHADGFTGGAPAATVTPSATDEQIILGGGTDAAPTYAGFYYTDATYFIHIGTDNAAPYGFYCAMLRHNVTDLYMFAHIPLEGYSSADVAPYIITLRTSNHFNGTILGDYNTGTALTHGLGSGYYKKGLGGEAWVRFPAMPFYAEGNRVPDTSSGYFAGNSGSVDLVAMPVARRSGIANPGWKGWVPISMMGWMMGASGSGIIRIAGGNRYVVLNNICLRWPPSDDVIMVR
jgi:hypothetical protein